MSTFNCATWSFFPEHNFWRWAKLTSIFLIISFRFGQQALFGVCVVPLDPLTFRFIIPLSWCHRRSITSLWSLSTKFIVIIINILTPSRISIEFMMTSTILSPRRIVLSPTTLLLPLQHKLVRVSSNYSSLPWSITIFYVKNVVRISPPLDNSWDK